jgi:hypothetical protein
VTENEIRTSFADGWRIDSIERTTIQSVMDPPEIQAWLARITRT